MLRFVLRKMLNKKWMVVSLLIGNILLIAIAAGSPMYSQAVLQRMLTKNLSSYLTENNRYPGTVAMRATYSKSAGAEALEKLYTVEGMMAGLPESFRLPAKEAVTMFYMTAKAEPEIQVEGEKESKSLRLGYLSDMPDHIKMTAGSLYNSQPQDGVLDVIVNERTLVEQNLLVGEVMTLPNTLGKGDIPYRVRIAGVFEANDPSELYWVSSASGYTDRLFMDETLFRQLFADRGNPNYSVDGEWYVLLDYQAMRGDMVPRMLALLDEYSKTFESYSFRGFRNNFQGVLTAYQPQAEKLNVTLWVFQAPIFVLLGAFIFMVSQQMLAMEQNEIAVLKSRGSKKLQILEIYLIQSLIISLLSFAAGIPLGMFICQALGASNAFLEFVQRSALTVELNQQAILFAVTAAVFSVCAMVLPAFRHANVTIVAHKQRKQRKWDAPWWQKCFLDVILLGVSLYGLYTFNGQKDFLAQQVLDGAPLDPLLYFSSSLFIIGSGLLGLRLVPLLVRLIFELGKRWWPPSLYASFLRVLRTRNSQGFIMIFLILTIALGIFNAQSARTINSNGEERIRYATGADVVVQEEWKTNSDTMAMEEGASSGMTELIYYEPDYGKYLDVENVISHTKVLYDNTVSAYVEGGTVNNVTLMGIHTKEFGETAWMKDGLLPIHWYHYLNAISQDARAILVSSNFKTVYGYETGDVITYSKKGGASIRGVIYGFVDYWPSYAPKIRSKNSDGLYQEKDNFLIVANLTQVQSTWGVTPYQIWFRMDGSSKPLYDFAEATGTRFKVFKDTQAELINQKNDPMFQGTNGVLTVGFIVVLLLCATGFLIYWILSIQSRVLQFGIFRAMGMSMREVLNMLINEQVFISGASVGIGVVVGSLSARLFVPLIQIAYAASDQVLPLEIANAAGDSMRLFAVIACMIAVCMLILGILISRIKISQALKLGED